jgi:hypothetical protein
MSLPTTSRRQQRSQAGEPTPFVAGVFWHCLSPLWVCFPRVSGSFQPSPIPCTGIIYSDIGTSPLYVLNGIWAADGPAPPKEDVIGGISAIIWAMTLNPLLKYVSTLYLQFEGS